MTYIRAAHAPPHNPLLLAHQRLEPCGQPSRRLAYVHTYHHTTDLVKQASAAVEDGMEKTEAMVKKAVVTAEQMAEVAGEECVHLFLRAAHHT